MSRPGPIEITSEDRPVHKVRGHHDVRAPGHHTGRRPLEPPPEASHEVSPGPYRPLVEPVTPRRPSDKAAKEDRDRRPEPPTQEAERSPERPPDAPLQRRRPSDLVPTLARPPLQPTDVPGAPALPTDPPRPPSWSADPHNGSGHPRRDTGCDRDPGRPVRPRCRSRSPVDRDPRSRPPPAPDPDPERAPP